MGEKGKSKSTSIMVFYTLNFLCFELLLQTGFNTQTILLILPKTMLYPSILYHETIQNKKGFKLL